MMQVYTNCIIIVRRVTLYFRRTQMNPIGFILLTILSFTTLAMADCHVWTETSTVRRCPRESSGSNPQRPFVGRPQ